VQTFVREDDSDAQNVKDCTYSGATCWKKWRVWL